ncbi:MAG: hypothetical protein ACJA1B_002598 [Polaribacter sp.]|jgi:hypothetical protein
MEYPKGYRKLQIEDDKLYLLGKVYFQSKTLQSTVRIDQKQKIQPK